MSTAPGWYPDPSGTGQQRYFDGANWGPVAPPVMTQPPSGEARVTIHWGFAVLAILSLLGTLAPTIFWFMAAANVKNDGTPEDIEAASSASGVMGLFGIGWLLWGGMWTVIWSAFAIHHTLKSRRR